MKDLSKRMGESEVVVYEEGLSSESVTNACNSAGTGPPQDYDSSDTSLKLGFVTVFHTTLIIPNKRGYFLFGGDVKSCVIFRWGKNLIRLCLICCRLPYIG